MKSRIVSRGARAAASIPPVYRGRREIDTPNSRPGPALLDGRSSASGAAARLLVALPVAVIAAARAARDGLALLDAERGVAPLAVEHAAFTGQLAGDRLHV